MQKKLLLKRIEFNPEILAGKPVIKDTRLAVEFVLNLLARGMTAEEILAEYDGLSQEDIQACILYAARSLEKTVILPLAG